MSPASTMPAPTERMRDADDVLGGARGSFLAIRGQCHRIVRVANRPQELITALTLIEREVMRLTECVERARRLLSDDGAFAHDEPAFDPHAVVVDAVDRFGAAAEERGVVLHVGRSQAAGSWVSDGDVTRRALDRLLETVITDAPGGSLTVTVCACGPTAGGPPQRDGLPGAA